MPARVHLANEIFLHQRCDYRFPSAAQSSTLGHRCRRHTHKQKKLPNGGFIDIAIIYASFMLLIPSGSFVLSR